MNKPTGRLALSAYQLFSNNLMRRCLEKGSIADACRSIGINRQQFNKYLSGKVLPSNDNLERIADYFAVSSPTFFTAEASESSQTQTVHQAFCDAIRADTARVQLREGLYWLHAYVTNDNSPMNRALFSISRQHGETRVDVLRRTGHAGRSDPGVRPIIANGMVIQGDSRISIMLKETCKAVRWGMLNFNSSDAEHRDLFPALLTSFRPDGIPFCTTTVLQFLDRDVSRWKRHFRGIGYLEPQEVQCDRMASLAASIIMSSAISTLDAPAITETVLRASIGSNRSDEPRGQVQQR